MAPATRLKLSAQLQKESTVNTKDEAAKAIGQLKKLEVFNEEQYSKLASEIFELLQCIIQVGGSFSLRPSKSFVALIVIDESLKNNSSVQNKIKRLKSNEYFSKLFALEWKKEQRKLPPAQKIKSKLKTPEEKKVHETIIDYVEEKTPPPSTKYGRILFQLIKDYKLDKATYMEVIDLGRTRTEVLQSYFSDLFVKGMTPIIKDKVLINSISNISIKAKVKEKTRLINVYVKDKMKVNHIKLSIEDLFVSRDIRIGKYVEPKVKNFLNMLSLDFTLFSNTFYRSTLDGYDFVKKNIELSNVTIRHIFKGLINYGYEYFDLTRPGTIKRIKVDKAYCSKAMGVLSSEAVYNASIYNPHVDVRITTQTHFVLIRVIREAFNFKKPDHIHIFWNFKTAVNSPDQFWELGK